MRRLWALYWIAAITMLGGLIGMGVMGARALSAAARCQCPSEARSDARPENAADFAHVPRLSAGQGVGSGHEPNADSAGSQAARKEDDR